MLGFEKGCVSIFQGFKEFKDIQKNWVAPKSKPLEIKIMYSFVKQKNNFLIGIRFNIDYKVYENYITTERNLKMPSTHVKHRLKIK